jgi:hypothetical protein
MCGVKLWCGAVRTENKSDRRHVCACGEYGGVYTHIILCFGDFEYGEDIQALLSLTCHSPIPQSQ